MPDPILQDQYLATFEARLRQQGSVSLISNAMTGVGVLHGAGQSHVAQKGAEGIDDPLPLGDPTSPSSCQQKWATRCLHMSSNSLLGAIVFSSSFRML